MSSLFILLQSGTGSALKYLKQRRTQTMKKTNKLAITYEKGGVGKTTTAVNLAAELALRGYKTLLLDLDFQAYASTYFGIEYRNTINEVVKGDVSATTAIVPTPIENLDLLPADKEFEKIERFLIERDIAGERSEFRLQRAMETVDKEYDFVIIDCPPNGGNIKENALVYADYLILPTIPDDNALSGLSVVAEKVLNVKRNTNPNLKILGLLITMTERTSLKIAYREALQSQNILPYFDTVIRKNAAIAEARNNRQPICKYRKRSNGAIDYAALAEDRKSVV